MAGVATQPLWLAGPRAHAEHVFYVVAGSLALIAAAGGFRLFILHGKGFSGMDITRPIVPLVVAHGLAMFGWVALFLLQSILILAGNRRLHMRIGPAGAVLAGAVVVLGAPTAALPVHFNPQPYAAFGGARFFLAIMWSELLLFAAFVTIGLLNRRRSEIHRPMMLLATAVITSGALARFPYTTNLAVLPPLYVYGPVLAFGALLLVLYWAMTRVANRWYAIGYAAVAITALLSVGVAHSAAWGQIAGMIVP